VLKDLEDLKVYKDSKETKDSKDLEDLKVYKDLKDSKVLKDQQEQHLILRALLQQ
jgi:hypothetical protein